MKSFKQFLNEEPAGRPAKKRTGGPSYDEVKAEIDAKEAAKAAKKAQRGPTGAAADTTKQFRPQGTTTNVSGPDVRGPEGPTPPTSSPSPSSPTTGRRSRVNGRVVPGIDKRQLPKPASPIASTPAKPTGTPVRPSIGNVSGPATSPKPPKQPVRPSIGNVTGPASNPKKQAFQPKTIDAAPSTSPSVSGAPKPSSASSAASSAAKQVEKSAAKEAEKVAAKTASKTIGKGILKGAGKIAGPASALLDVADERSKGSGWLRSLAKGATVAAGGALGGAGGTAAGPVGTVAGAVGGSMAASKAFDTVAGANAKERKGIATANRKSQAGGAIKGVGGKTSFDTKKNTITSGGKTAQLGKTSVVTGPGGKQEVGNLAYKDGKAVYKRSDTKSLAQTSSNPLERIGRSLFAGAYKANDAKLAAAKLKTAATSDAARNKALGVKFGPGK
jgi:hypothetical protein